MDTDGCFAPDHSCEALSSDQGRGYRIFAAGPTPDYFGISPQPEQSRSLPICRPCSFAPCLANASCTLISTNVGRFVRREVPPRQITLHSASCCFLSRTAPSPLLRQRASYAG